MSTVPAVLAAVGVHVVLREGEVSVLHVRSYEGVVRCGTKFLRAFGPKQWSSKGPSIEIALTVVRIRLYGRDFDYLDSGITGALTVTGTVPLELGEGWVVSE